MADPGMLSLFGDDANLFSDGLEGLGDCGFPQGQPNPMGQQMPHEHQGYGSLSSNSLHHTSQAVPGQPKMGHPYDPFAGYEQQQGRMLGNGPAVNGMASPHSRYHNNPQQPGGGHHVYPGAQGDGLGQPFPDGGAVWGPQAGPGQSRPPFQQQQAAAQATSHQQHVPSGPQGHGHQMGPYMGRADYATMQGHPGQTQTPPRVNHFPQGMGQEPNHYMGHVGLQQNPSMTGPPMRHPAQQQQPPQQFLHRPGQGPVHPQEPMASHTPRFPHSPSRQQQVLAGRPHQNMGFNMHGQAAPPGAVTSSGQYPPYPQYGNLNQGLAGTAGMSPGMSLSSTNNNSNASGPMGPAQVPRYPNVGGPPQRYPGPQVHQQPVHPNQITGQPMHPSQPMHSFYYQTIRLLNSFYYH